MLVIKIEENNNIVRRSQPLDPTKTLKEFNNYKLFGLVSRPLYIVELDPLVLKNAVNPVFINLKRVPSWLGPMNLVRAKNPINLTASVQLTHE